MAIVAAAFVVFSGISAGILAGVGIVATGDKSNIVHLIDKGLEKREKALFDCAAVEKDKCLNDEMSDWDVTLHDGLKDETW